MKRSMIALLIALLMTACLGAAMFTIGGAALLNKNGVPASNSQVQLADQASSVTTANDQVGQLQSLVSQYQDREKQYQQREQDLQNQLAQANAQIQADQQIVQQARTILTALQQRGLIRITNDGRIFVN